MPENPSQRVISAGAGSRRGLLKASLAGALGLPFATPWGDSVPVQAAISVAIRDAHPLAAPLRQATPIATPSGDPAAAIEAIARDAMTTYGLRAMILQVQIAGEGIVTLALGESMTGVPATPEMHFRNGAVAISYVSTLLLLLVDDGVITLDDSLSNWLPDLPDSDGVTLRMLANMTAGYPDYVQNAAFIDAYYADPFWQWAPEELIDFGLSTPRLFAPGTNWDYSHTDYVILGRALEAITGQTLDALLQEKVLTPSVLPTQSVRRPPRFPNRCCMPSAPNAARS